MAEDISADVIIVGSGIAGALLAARARRRRGRRSRSSRPGGEVDRGTAVQTLLGCGDQGARMPLPADARRRCIRSRTTCDSWYEQAGPDLFSSTYLKVVGGTTWHWLGTCLRFVPNDFRLKTLYGQAVDWPISYDELEPFYGEAEAEIGVSGRCRRRPRRAAQRRLSDAGDPADLSRQDLRQGAGGDRTTRCARRRRGGCRRTSRPAGLLRQCQLHPGLPGAGQVRRHDPSRPRDRGGGGAACRDHGGLRRGRRRSRGHRASASSAGTAARAAPPARSSSSPPMPSRRRGCC